MPDRQPLGLISIHAPRVGSNLLIYSKSAMMLDFNPRSPCGERLTQRVLVVTSLPFQSTLPVWGATSADSPTVFGTRFQSTLPVWGATSRRRKRPQICHISIHAPRVGSDSRRRKRPQICHISIHAPRVGSDPLWWASFSRPSYFNPRSPCGERHNKAVIERALIGFQSTLPVWGATVECGKMTADEAFQSTLPVWGATWLFPHSQSLGYFNPRSPCGERPNLISTAPTAARISIHAPRVGSDQRRPPPRHER